MKNIVLLCFLFSSQAVGIAPSALAQIVVAHRGASSDAPENSLSSFKLAWEQGADAVEGDFYLTADKQIVCIHDATTKRVSGVNLKVAESTLATLAKLDVGSWKDQRFLNERIPTIQEVLAVIPPGKRIFIEIKCGPEILPYLKPLLMDSNLDSKQLTIISFNQDVIRTAKLVMPDFQTYWLIDFKKDKQKGLWYPSVDDIVETASRIGADGIDVRAQVDLFDTAFLMRCMEAGLSLHAWTVDDANDAMKLGQLGFDSITTNRPAFLLQSLSRQTKPWHDTKEKEEPQPQLPAHFRTGDDFPAGRIGASTE